MKNSPEVSVIVPVYGVEKYLSRCVDSILAQTFSDFELILVDDGSPDNCGAICDEYAARDSRVRVIHKENGGVSKARNAALDIAQGTYIAFCDSDDYYFPTYLQKMIKARIESNADMIICNCVTADDGTILKESQICHGIANISEERDKLDFFISLFEGVYGWEIWTKLFEKEIIRNNHIRFNENCNNYAEDLGFVLEYLLFSKRVHCIEDIEYCYSVRAGSMMHCSKDVLKLNELNEVSYGFFKRYSKEIESKDIIAKYPILHFLFINTELRRIIGTEEYSHLGEAMRTIARLDWCKDQLRRVCLSKAYLHQRFGERIAKQILLGVHYCIHGNWKRFCYESVLAYKWLIPKE